MAKCICPNELNRRITVEKVKSDATIDDSGRADETLDANWVQCGREWAKCITKGSREFVLVDQLREDISHQWLIRYSRTASAYTTGMRLRMDGRKFNIAAPPINIDEMNEWIRIETVETAGV